MHDPMTVAFEIKFPFNLKKSKVSKDQFKYRLPIVTIWHVDPETDGTDDSCGWFMRSRHGDENVLKEIQKEFEFNLKHNYWFDEDWKPVFSTIGTVIEMYRHASWIYFKRNRKKQDKFMKNHLYDIISFAENPIDSIGGTITNKWSVPNEHRGNDILELASTIYGDILRKERKWYQHPKWHIHHWKIQFNFIQDFLKNFKKKDIAYVHVDQNLRDIV